MKGRKNIDSFDLSEETIVKAIAGAERISSDRAYGGFKGKWYGQWDKMSVDHHWGRLVEPEKPQRVEVAGDEPVWIRSYQYCWVGDGYDGVHIFGAEDGKRIGQIKLPEICSNVCFGGKKRNRLFMTASTSLYAVYVETTGAHIT